MMTVENFMKDIEDQTLNKGRVHSIMWRVKENGVILLGKLNDVTTENSSSIRLHFDKTSYKVDMRYVTVTSDDEINVLVIDHEDFKLMFTTTDDPKESNDRIPETIVH